MRTLLTSVVVLMVTGGCRPTEEDIRNIVREEIAIARNAVHLSLGNTIGPYSPAVRVGNLLFVSGQIGIDERTGALASDNIEIETRQVLRNVSAVLSSQGYVMGDIISATVYLKNIDNFQAMNSIYATFFEPGKYPTRSTVEVSRLPRNANIEIAVIAYRNEQR